VTSAVTRGTNGGDAASLLSVRRLALVSNRRSTSCDTLRVAGGMHPGRSGRSLGERAARSGFGPPEPPATPPQSASTSRPDQARGRHCWVHDPPGAPGVWPGLLVEWRQGEGGWSGRVTYAVAGPQGTVLVEAWVPAALLEQR
jgi:hypothetical protein